MSVCQMDDSPWCTTGKCKHCDGARTATELREARARGCTPIVEDHFISNGYEIEVQRPPYGRHVQVSIHKLGSQERSWLTPDELEKYVQALQSALRTARSYE